MKHVLVLMLLALGAIVPAPVNGQPGEIVLYMDTYGNGNWQCWYDDAYYTTMLRTVYVMHEGTAGATGSRFRLEGSRYLGFAYGLAMSAYTVTGRGDLEGLTVEYGACLEGNILIAEVIYSTFFGSTPCSFITPVAHAEVQSGEIEVTLCDGTVAAAGARPLTVNPRDWFDYQCVPWCATSIPVEPTTWGRIKALYSE
jgi:hypothetical protein